MGSQAHSLLKHTGGCCVGQSSSLIIWGLWQSLSILQYSVHASDSMYISTRKRKYIVVLNIRKCLYATFKEDEGKIFQNET